MNLNKYFFKVIHGNSMSNIQSSKIGESKDITYNDIDSVLLEYNLERKDNQVVFSYNLEGDKAKIFEEIKKKYLDPYLQMNDTDYKKYENIIKNNSKINQYGNKVLKITNDNIDEIESLINSNFILFWSIIKKNNYLFNIEEFSTSKELLCWKNTDQKIFTYIFIQSYIKNKNTFNEKSLDEFNQTMEIIKVYNTGIHKLKKKELAQFIDYNIRDFKQFLENVNEFKHNNQNNSIEPDEYEKNYKDILNKNTKDSIGIRFLAHGKEQDFKKLYDIAYSGKETNMKELQDIILNLLYQDSPCGMLGDYSYSVFDDFNNKNIQANSLIPEMQLFINDSIKLISDKNPKYNFLNYFCLDYDRNKEDFIAKYINLVNMHVNTALSIDFIKNNYIGQSLKNLISITEKSINENKKELDALKNDQNRKNEDDQNRKNEIEEEIKNLEESLKDLKKRYYFQIYTDTRISFSDFVVFKDLEIQDGVDIAKSFESLSEELAVLYTSMKKDYEISDENTISINFQKLETFDLDKKNKFFQDIFKFFHIYNEMKYLYLQELLNIQKSQVEISMDDANKFLSELAKYKNIMEFQHYHNSELIQDQLFFEDKTSKDIVKRFEENDKTKKEYKNFNVKVVEENVILGVINNYRKAILTLVPLGVLSVFTYLCLAKKISMTMGLSCGFVALLTLGFNLYGFLKVKGNYGLFDAKGMTSFISSSLGFVAISLSFLGGKALDIGTIAVFLSFVLAVISFFIDFKGNATISN